MSNMPGYLTVLHNGRLLVRSKGSFSSNTHHFPSMIMTDAVSEDSGCAGGENCLYVGNPRCNKDMQSLGVIKTNKSQLEVTEIYQSRDA